MAEKVQKKSPPSPCCSRCRNHGVYVPVKGHKKQCRWKNCECCLCVLTIRRRQIVATQISLKRHQEQIAKQCGIQHENVLERGNKDSRCLTHHPDQGETKEFLRKFNLLKKLFPDQSSEMIHMIFQSSKNDFVTSVESLLLLRGPQPTIPNSNSPGTSHDSLTGPSLGHYSSLGSYPLRDQVAAYALINLCGDFD